ncbi:MAG TPA: adenylate/guanylate cyclase domain-containing protein, partial [Solirubrobacterales bacterium]|nr:adenylate/guanylate cyclase domain-containing protein [Solirubrobacterales bacterium]
MSWDTDYTFANSPETRKAMIDAWIDQWGSGLIAGAMAPSLADDAEFIEWYSALERLSSAPGTTRRFMDLVGQLDVRSVLPSVRVPTLVMHPQRDGFMDRGHGEYLADHIPGASFVEIPGADNLPLALECRSFIAEEIEEFVTGARRTTPIDRVLSTVLFTDIVGSTRRASELGDRAWHDELDRHDKLVRRELARHRGREVKNTGDGFLAAFDGPERAVRCAMAISESSNAAGIGVRAGLHTGECEVRGEDLGGLAVHIGARVAALAGEQEVLVSQTVRDLVVGSRLEFAERGEHELKGVPGTWRLFAAA